MHVWICICHIASVYMQMLVYFNIYILAKLWSLKRGRGRPRKDSLYSNFSNTQNSYLEEGKLFGVFDLYFFFCYYCFTNNLLFMCYTHAYTNKINAVYFKFVLFSPFLFLVEKPIIFLVFFCNLTREKMATQNFG